LVKFAFVIRGAIFATKYIPPKRDESDPQETVAISENIGVEGLSK
jgi:hypothetical protein